MRKGFIFSLDAVFAIVLMIAATGMLLLFVYPQNPGMQKISALEQNTHDAAIVGFYLNKNAQDYGLDDNPDSSRQFYYCYKLFKYEFIAEAPLEQGSIVAQNFCEES